MRTIDPPDGWRFGFPKRDARKEGESTEAWLEENGYPKRMIDRFPDGVPCIIWGSYDDPED